MGMKRLEKGDWVDYVDISILPPLNPPPSCSMSPPTFVTRERRADRCGTMFPGVGAYHNYAPTSFLLGGSDNAGRAGKAPATADRPPGASLHRSLLLLAPIDDQRGDATSWGRGGPLDGESAARAG